MTQNRNVPESIRQCLYQLAKKNKRPFNEILQYYSMERFLYRMSKSKHAEKFILKGALMMRVWQVPEFRPTMDIDILGKISNNETTIVAQIKDIMIVDVEQDGLIFNQESMRTEPITKEADYEGLRLRFECFLTTAKVIVQIDFGFGDIVYPKPEILELPASLDFPAAKLLCYSRESVIAEKFEAIVKLGMLNSRMKDFFDICLLSRQYNFEGARLAEAIKLTFQHRGTALPSKIEAFDQAFIETKQIQWVAFWKKLQQNKDPEPFENVVSTIEKFISPLIPALSHEKTLPKKWPASGPWSS